MILKIISSLILTFSQIQDAGTRLVVNNTLDLGDATTFSGGDITVTNPYGDGYVILAGQFAASTITFDTTDFTLSGKLKIYSFSIYRLTLRSLSHSSILKLISTLLIFDLFPTYWLFILYVFYILIYLIYYLFFIIRNCIYHRHNVPHIYLRGHSIGHPLVLDARPH